RGQDFAREGVPDPPLGCDGLAVRRVSDVMDVALSDRSKAANLAVLRHVPEADRADLPPPVLHRAANEYGLAVGSDVHRLDGTAEPRDEAQLSTGNDVPMPDGAVVAAGEDRSIGR